MKKLIISVVFVFSFPLFLFSQINLEKIERKVLMIVHNPYIESRGKTLIELFKWKNPDSLARVCINDLRECSGGYLNFRIVEKIEIDEYPVKSDGFKYDDSSYLECWTNRKSCHQPDGVDYYKIIEDFNIYSKIKSGKIDEIWLFGFPYGGYWESIMVGKDAFYCNSDPITNIDCGRKFIIMGFNFERGVGEMLEDFGHRTESIMMHVFGGWEQNENNDWNKFTLYDKIAPGKAQCGNIHFAPNSLKDYDWANKSIVMSACDDWLNYPDLKGIKRKVDCKDWGCEIRAHHKWWFTRLPKAPGKKDGKWNNWWKYVFDYDNAVK
jgi:hypothetical protein